MTMQAQAPTQRVQSPPAFLNAPGEMAELIRTVDWSQTPLGPAESWPQSLRTSLSICLHSHFPILLWWGPELVMLYNDAYRPMLGASKHPAAMGQPGQEFESMKTALQYISARLELPIKRFIERSDLLQEQLRSRQTTLSCFS